MPENYPLAIYRGDSYRWIFVLWADAERTVPADLEGASVRADIRQTRRLTSLVCTVTDNAIEVVLEAAASQLLQVMAAAWDLEITYASGDVQTILSGPVTITADSTQPVLGLAAA